MRPLAWRETPPWAIRVIRGLAQHQMVLAAANMVATEKILGREVECSNTSLVLSMWQLTTSLAVARRVQAWQPELGFHKCLRVACQ